MKYGDGSMDAVDVVDNHVARSDGHYCKCGKQAPLSGAKGWYARHLLEELKSAGYTLMRPVTAAEEAANQW